MDRVLGRCGDRHHFGVPPEALQFVISARLRRKHVDQVIAVIGQNPLGIPETFDADRIFAALLQLRAISSR